MPRSNASRIVDSRSAASSVAPQLRPHRPGAEPEARLGRYETRRGPDVSPGPRVHRTAPSGVAGRPELARLDHLGTMTAGGEGRGSDDLDPLLPGIWAIRKTAVWANLPGAAGAAHP